MREQFVNGEKINAVTPVDGAVFYSMKNPEIAQRAADMINLFECLQRDFDNTNLTRYGTNFAPHVGQLGRFNTSSASQAIARPYIFGSYADGSYNLDEYQGGIGDSPFKGFRMDNHVDFYILNYGIDIASQIPKFNEWNKWDRDMVVHHANEMANKVVTDFNKLGDLYGKDMESVPYKYDSKKKFGGQGHNIFESTYSQIDSSYYVPTEYSMQPVFENTIVAQIEKVMSQLGLEMLKPMPRAMQKVGLLDFKGKQEKEKIEKEIERIAAENKGIQERNYGKIQGKFADIIKSLEEGAHAERMTNTPMSVIQQKQLKGKEAESKPVSLPDQEKEKIKKAFENGYSHLPASLQEHDIVNGPQGEAIKMAVWQEVKKLVLGGTPAIEIFKPNGMLKDIFNQKINEVLKANLKKNAGVDGSQ